MSLSRAKALAFEDVRGLWGAIAASGAGDLTAGLDALRQIGVVGARV